MPGRQLLCVLGGGGGGGTYLATCSSRAATAAHRASQTKSTLHLAGWFKPVGTWRAHPCQRQDSLLPNTAVYTCTAQLLLLSLKQPHRWQR